MIRGHARVADLWLRLRTSRLTGGVTVNYMALAAQIIIQLLSVPVLTSAYGVQGFGIWLILVTIPTYLTMSDLGLITAATTEMGIRWGRGDERGVLAIFQSVWAGMASLATLVTLAAFALIFFTAPIPGLWPEELRPHLWVIPILTCYAAMWQVSFVLAAGLRGTGHFARGTLLLETPTFLEGVAMLSVASITRDMTAAAAVMLAIRIVSTPIIYLGLRHVRPQLWIGTSQLSWQELRALLPSALGVLTIPGSLAMMLQGTALIIGAVIGPAAVVVFSTARTASRFALQIATMIVRAIVPEIAAAHGRGDLEAQRRYWLLYQRTRWLILVPAALAFGLLGSWLIDLWSFGRVEAPQALVIIMGLALLPHGSWFLDFFMLTATHRHVSLSRPILLLSALGLGATVVATIFGGLIGGALSVLLLDLVLAWRVRKGVRKVMQQPVEAAGHSSKPA